MHCFSVASLDLLKSNDCMVTASVACRELCTSQDPANRKGDRHLYILHVQARQLMAKSLRHVAHLYGASLVYLGGLKSPSAGVQTSSSHKDAAADKAALTNFRSMLSHMLFIGMDKRM